MPLVRIPLMKNRPNGFGKKIGAILYQAVVDTINVPVKDNFQIITEHDSDTLIYDPTYLDIRRTDGIIVIQITLNEGRAASLKIVLLRWFPSWSSHRYTHLLPLVPESSARDFLRKLRIAGVQALPTGM